MRTRTLLFAPTSLSGRFTRPTICSGRVEVVSGAVVEYTYIGEAPFSSGFVCAEAPTPTLRPIEVRATDASASASNIISSAISY
jgi:hypothetical protein